MSTQWLIILAVLLVISFGLLIAAYARLRRQNFLIRLQSKEIEKQIRELIVQNQIQEDVNRERKQLVLLVSHDLKGPFNRIFALMQLLEMTANNFTGEQKEYFGKMYQIVGDGLNMVRNLVDVRKMEERGVDPHPEKISLGATISSIVNQYRVSAEKKRITMNFKAPDKTEFVTDKNYVSRIMENLLSNAVKFSSSDKTVTVSLQVEGNNAIISVRDEGPGIGPEDQAQLYQKFKKLTARPTGGESSTGLGLSIVKQLANSMGGDVTCQSELEKGATFTVRLPQMEISKPS